MSKLPAQHATAQDNMIGSNDNFPVIPIQAADGAIASAQPSNKLAVHVNLFVNG